MGIIQVSVSKSCGVDEILKHLAQDQCVISVFFLLVSLIVNQSTKQICQWFLWILSGFGHAEMCQEWRGV